MQFAKKNFVRFENGKMETGEKIKGGALVCVKNASKTRQIRRTILKSSTQNFHILKFFHGTILKQNRGRNRIRFTRPDKQ